MVHAVSLTGLTPYREAYELQLKLVDLRIQDKIPDTVLFLEHMPVITRGRGLQNISSSSSEKQVPITAKIPKEIEVVDIERGGDLTYHGPGQLVAYPIFKINDVHQYLRKMEQVLMDCLKTFGLNGSTKENATGVWVGDRKENKIASIGVAVRKWVTYHGLALNCVNDLKPFSLISPCGFSADVMCRLSDRAKLDESWRENLETDLATRFGAHAIIDVSCQDLLKDPSVLFSSSDYPETHPASSS